VNRVVAPKSGWDAVQIEDPTPVFFFFFFFFFYAPEWKEHVGIHENVTAPFALPVNSGVRQAFVHPAMSTPSAPPSFAARLRVGLAEQ